MKHSVAVVLCLASLALALPLSAGGQKETVQLKELNVSFVDSPFNLQVMVMKDQGLLEKEFAADGIQVNWHGIASGAKQAEAMAAGSLDIASVMNTASLIIANAAGNTLDALAVVSRPSGTFTIMAMPGGPKTIKDLAGKTVAGPKGTVLHQLLASVEAKEGLEGVKFASMGLAEAQAALLAGRVDAALLAGALVVKTQAAGGQVITTSDGYVNPLLVSVASEAFIKAHPGIVARYCKVQKQAFDYIRAHTDEALAIGARIQGITIQEARELYSRSGMADAFVQADLKALQEDGDFLKSQEMIEQAVSPSALLAPGLEIR